VALRLVEGLARIADPLRNGPIRPSGAVLAIRPTILALEIAEPSHGLAGKPANGASSAPPHTMNGKPPTKPYEIMAHIRAASGLDRRTVKIACGDGGQKEVPCDDSEMDRPVSYGDLGKDVRSGNASSRTTHPSYSLTELRTLSNSATHSRKLLMPSLTRCA